MEITEFKKFLSTPRQIVITTHHKPDGDALGSSLGFLHILKGMGHKVTVISPSDFPSFFDWMPGRGDILLFPESIPEATSLVRNADLICCLDFNHLKRINELGELVAESKAVKIMVDHHLDPQGFDDFRFWDTETSSTAELIYRLAFDLGLQERITAEVATCLYTGIMTDTGSFRFPRTTPALHRIVASLIEAGADNVAIHELVYDQYTLSRLHFLGYCLKEKLVVIDELNTAYFAISAEELDQFTIQTGDTEGIVNYALALSGIKLAVLIIQRHDMIKLSFRSTGDFPCNLLANKYFNGGGHKNASGGMSLDNLPVTIKKFTDALVEFRQLLVI